MLETEPEVVLCTAPMPQVATSMLKELGPFVDGPPGDVWPSVAMCESYATPGPAGCAGAACDHRDPDVTLTKLVPRLSVAMIVWFVMIILLRAPVSSWHSPSRLLRLELWAWRQSYCSPAKIHRVVEGPHGADAGPQLQLSAPAPQANCSTTARHPHKDLLATSSPPSFAPRRLQLRTGRRSARSVIWGELLVRHAVDVAPSPMLCKAPSRHDALVLRTCSCGAAQEGVYGSSVPVGGELLK